MGTAYTLPVIDGKIKTLEQFAMECSKQFSLDYDFQENPPSYFRENLSKDLQEIKRLEDISSNDELLLDEYKSYIKGQIENKTKYSDTLKVEFSNLKSMFELVKNWNIIDNDPYCENLKDLKKFMLNQLTETIERNDYKESFATYLADIKRLQTELSLANIEVAKESIKERILKKYKDIKYSSESLLKLINNWEHHKAYRDAIIKSINNQ